MDGNILASMGQDNSVEALGVIWGERNAWRRTKGSGHRTILLTHLLVLADDFGYTEMTEFATDLSDLWAGEEGWETERLIRAMQAVKVQTMVQAADKELKQ